MPKLFKKRTRQRLIDALEARRLFTAVSPINDVALADQMVANIQPANNVYAYGTPTVTWAGVNGASSYSNASDCSTFQVMLLEQAYGFTPSQFTDWTGKTLPQAKDLYNAALTDSGFTGFTQIADVQPGDEMFIDYLDASTDTGHCVMFDQLPELETSSATQRTYTAVIIDCTADPHTDDTRSGSESGVGRGTIRLYTDGSGNLTAYSWGLSNQSVVETAAVRPAIFAKMPAGAGNAFLSAGSQASWNASTHVLNVTGPSSIITDPNDSALSVNVNSSSGNLMIMPGATPVVHMLSLSVTNGATVTVYDPSTGAIVLDIAANTSTAGVVNVDSTSKLDLQDNDLLIHDGAASLAAITNSIKTGFAGGKWNGKGIDSSVANADTTHLTALSIMQNTNGSAVIYSKFDGYSSSTSDVLIKFTYYGDTNLDGKVDASDYSRIDNAFINPTIYSGWANGDLNYDGVINGSDYTLMDNAFNKQGAAKVFSPSAEIAITTKPAFPVLLPAPDPNAFKKIKLAGRVVLSLNL